MRSADPTLPRYGTDFPATWGYVMPSSDPRVFVEFSCSFVDRSLVRLALWTRNTAISYTRHKAQLLSRSRFEKPCAGPLCLNALG